MIGTRDKTIRPPKIDPHGGIDGVGGTLDFRWPKKNSKKPLKGF